MKKRTCFQFLPRTLLCILAVLQFSVLVFSQDVGKRLSGIVFVDKNQNGFRDDGEVVLSGIAVSNGVDVVYTNRKGQYELSILPGQFVFPILPDGLMLHPYHTKLLNRNFYRWHPDSLHIEIDGIDFPLLKYPKSNRFTFSAIGDVQVGDSLELHYAAKSVFSELSSISDMKFHLFLGDLINDDVKLFPPIRDMIRALPVSSWILPGNHDRNMKDLDRMDTEFSDNFGASTYAFHAGKAFFLVFNNVYPTVKYGYEGRYRIDQLQFLESALKNVPKERLIVISQHIPMAFTRNREEIFKLLRGYKHVLILSAHTHQVSRHFYENGAHKIHEVVTGAPSGTWWTGEQDINGIPLALMQCGSPRNYFTVEVDQNDYRIHFKGIGLDGSNQMDIRLQDSLVTANIFAGSSQTEVMIQVNGGRWQLMEQAALPAPSVEEVVTKNKNNIYPTSGNRTLALRNRPSPHLWTFPVNAVSVKGLLKIKIKAQDNFGFSVAQEQWVFNP